MRYFRMIWSHFRKKIYESKNVKHGNFKNVNRTLEQPRTLKKMAAQIIRGDAKVWNCVRIIFRYRIQPLKYRTVSNFWWPQINRL